MYLRCNLYRCNRSWQTDIHRVVSLAVGLCWGAHQAVSVPPSTHNRLSGGYSELSNCRVIVSNLLSAKLENSSLQVGHSFWIALMCSIQAVQNFFPQHVTWWGSRMIWRQTGHSDWTNRSGGGSTNSQLNPIILLSACCWLLGFSAISGSFYTCT